MTTKVRTAIVALAGLLLTACQPDGFTYVHNSQEGAYVRFPSDWHLFDAEELLDHQYSNLTPQARDIIRRQEWAVAFDADPEPTLEHLSPEPNEFPFGVMQVRQLGEVERDYFSLSSLRNLFVPFDEIRQSSPGSIEPLLLQDLTTPGGLRGERLRFNVATVDGVITYDQSAYVDADTRTLYALLVGCAVECFKAHTSQIDQIAESWTIKEPKV